MSQAREAADQLLDPSQELYAGASGCPAYSNDAPFSAGQRAQHFAASNFETLLSGVSDLAPAALQGASQSDPQVPSGVLIEEVSEQAVSIQESTQEQMELAARSCQVAALYAADAALLTPWSSHQLDTAARALLKQLCAAMGTGNAGMRQSRRVQPTDQDLFATLLPTLLPILSPCLSLEAAQPAGILLHADQGAPFTTLPFTLSHVVLDLAQYIARCCILRPWLSHSAINSARIIFQHLDKAVPERCLNTGVRCYAKRSMPKTNLP